MKKGLWSLTFFLVINFLLFQPTYAKITFDSNTNQFNIHNNMEILEDKSGDLTLEDVMSPEYSNQFKKNDGGIPNFGYTSSVFWLKFDIENKSDRDKLILEFPYAPHDYITVYELTQTGLNKYEGGDLLPFKERVRSHRYVTFNISVPINKVQTYYVRIQSEGSLQLPVVLWKNEAYTEKSIKEYLLLGIYHGITLAMIVYNLFLYASLRFKSYIWYIFVLIGFSLTQLAFTGLAYQFLWPDLPWWNQRSIVFSMAITCIFGSIFVNKFLEVKSLSKRLSVILDFAVLLNVIYIIILMFYYKLALYLVSATLSIIVIFILLIAFISWKKGNKYAKYLFFGWFVFLVCSVLSVAADASIIPINTFTKYIALYGSVFEMIFFSLALAERVKVIQQEKEIAEKQALKIKEIAIENLKKADRIKDEFLTNTTHELRTPLHGMIGIAESLRDGIAGEPNHILKQNLSLIIQNGYRLLNLINDILDYSKLKTHEIKLDLGPVRLQDAVNVVIMLNEPLLKNKEVKIINNVPSDTPLIYADENRVVQILQNLIGNAIKFTAEGTITITAKTKGNQVFVEIIDTGIGIQEDELETIFNEFEQGSNSKQIKQRGTGIGLNITKNLVQLHGGTISITSQYGQGTTVSFTMPIYENAVDVVPSSLYKEKKIVEEETNIISYKENGAVEGNILIADDDAVNIQVLVNHLKLKLPNYNIVIASDGEEILSILNEKIDFDLIILDLMMPKKSGYEVCAEIRKTYSITELPVLILTARSNINDMVAAFHAGANDYLIKPYFKEELLARVETLLTLKKVMKEIQKKTEELNALNDELEMRVLERTKELKQKNEELLFMESSRRHLLANISHDIGTPLTSIQGYVRAMLDEIIEPSKEYFETIFEKTQYIYRLIEDLHDLSTLETKKARFDMKDVVLKNFVFEFLKSFEADVTANNLQFELKNYLNKEELQYSINIDIDRIRQVLENIISNAVKYSKENGVICIEVHDCERFIAKRQLENNLEETASSLDVDLLERNGKYIIIAVRDNGVGIDSEFLPYIFNRYYRADTTTYKNYKNMGLGLAIAKEIIDYHNGIIWVESQKDVGSTFYVALTYKRNRVK